MDDKDINGKKIMAAIREAVDERKGKTWYNFYGIPYEDMYAFLGEDHVTITKARHKELLDYERIARWAINSIIVASLPDIEMKAEKLKELSNDARRKAVQAAFQEAIKGKE